MELFSIGFSPKEGFPMKGKDKDSLLKDQRIRKTKSGIIQRFISGSQNLLARVSAVSDEVLFDLEEGWLGVRGWIAHRFTKNERPRRETVVETRLPVVQTRKSAKDRLTDVLWGAIFPLLVPVVKLKEATQRLSDSLAIRARIIPSAIQRLLASASVALSKHYQRYVEQLKRWDASLEAFDAVVNDIWEQIRLSLEGIERRIGVQLRGASARIRVGSLFRKRWWEFVVLKPEIFNKLPDEEIDYIWMQFHEHLTPIKFLYLGEKSMGAISRNAEWCQAEFARTRKDWDIYLPHAKLDPDAWRESMEWLIECVGHQSLVWNTWMIIPASKIPDSVLRKLLEHVDYEDLFLDRLEFETLVYKLFNPLCDSEPDDLEKFSLFKRHVSLGKRVWNALLPQRLAVEKWGMQTSSGSFMTSVQLYSLGTETVTYYQPKDDQSQEVEARTTTIIRDMEWLKKELSQALLLDSRRDQQIWLSTSVVGVPPSRWLQGWLQRHLRTLGAWEKAARDSLPYPARLYAELIKRVCDELDGSPNLSTFHQSYALLLKAADADSLKALQDRVQLILEGRQVFFSFNAHQHEHWREFRRMLPVIWKHELEEAHEAIRNTMPMTLLDLHTLLKTPEIYISPVGGIVGLFGDGKPLVIGPGNFGILGTTEVGKSISLLLIIAMTYPLACAETEVFVFENTGKKPDSELPAWYPLLIEFFGGKVFFPSLYATPALMKAALDRCEDDLVFLYYSDEDLPDAEAYDMEFLHFVLRRMEQKREERPEDLVRGQLSLPGFEALIRPRKRIRRRFFVGEEIETLLQKKEDPRVSFIANRIMSQARSREMSCIYSEKDMEGAKHVNPGAWSMFKTITDKGWFLFWTPDAASVPETITYPRDTPESSWRADQIVHMIENIRKMGGLTDVTLTYGRSVYATGAHISYAQFIPPKPVLEIIKRKKEPGWGG